MAKLRVYELAKELGLGSKALILELEKLGVEVRSHMSSLDEDAAKLVRDSLKADKEEKGEQEKIRVTEGLTVGQLSEKIGVKPN